MILLIRNQLIDNTVNAAGVTENEMAGMEPTEIVEIGGTDEWVRKLSATKLFITYSN
jgi:hypothetical protein